MSFARLARLRPAFFSLPFSVLFIAGTLAVTLPAGAQRVFSSVHHDAERQLPVTLNGGTDKLNARLSASGKAVSLATGDFDRDGTADLLTGFALDGGGALVLQRGAPAALSPGENEMAMLAAGQAVHPYLAQGTSTEIPVRPDLLRIADIDFDGALDAVVAAKKDSTVYLLKGDNQGGFAAPIALALSGKVSSLALWNTGNGSSLIAAGVCSSSGCGVQMIASDGTTKAFIPTSAAVTVILPGRFNRGGYDDLALIAGKRVLIADGDSLLSGAPRTDAVPVSTAIALASGAFVYNRRGGLQLAVLDGGATLHLLVRPVLDTTFPTSAERRAARLNQGMPEHLAKLTGKPWTEVETISNIGDGSDAAHLFSGHFSGRGADDLVVLAGGRYVQVSQATVADENRRTSTPVITEDSTGSIVQSAVVARVSADVRPALVTTDGTRQPRYAAPATYHIFNVNTNADGVPTAASRAACTNGTAGCTLRSAIANANADAASTAITKVDTINLPANTYTLSATNNGSTTDVNGDNNYHFDLDGSVNIIGAGASSTTINANSLDNIFAISTGVGVSGVRGGTGAAPLDILISGVTLTKGSNLNNSNGYDYNGGAIQQDSYGNGQLTMNNVVLTSNRVNYNYGGAIGTFNSIQASGGAASGVEIDNSTILNNSSTEGSGGVEIGGYSQQMILTNDTVTGNGCTVSVSDPNSNATNCNGGGVFLSEQVYAPISTITGTTISTNTTTSGGYGGAIYLNDNGITISGSTISGNTGGAEGGAIYQEPGTPAGDYNNVSITTTNILSNKLTNPASTGTGAIHIVPYGQTVTMHYSRIHGNTGGNYSGFYAMASSGTPATFNLIDNWWGCNGAAAGTGCDTSNVLGGNVTAPYTTLTLTLNSTSPVTNSTITATGSLGQDSAGTVYSIANAAGYDVVPATLTIVQNGGPSSGSSQTTLSNNVATATSYAAIVTSATATSTGQGTATVTVDGTAVQRTFNVTAPVLSVTSTHTGNFKAGDTADAYTLTVANIGTGSTSGTVTLTDTLPSGFTATALSGTGWTCTLSSRTCTRSDGLSASGSYPPVTLTVSVAGTDIGTYTNTAAASGGGASNFPSSNDSTIVVGQPTIAQAFSPTQVASGGTSSLTFTLANPSGNAVSLTGVGFSDTGTGISFASALTSNSCGGTYTLNSATSITYSGATIAAGATCTVVVQTTATANGSASSVSSAVTATNSNAGNTSSAMLTVGTSTTTAVSVGSTTLTVGGTTQITASVSDTTGVTPTGMVTFYDTVNGSTSTLGTAPVSGSGSTATGSLTYSAATSGSHLITATYTPGSSAFTTSSDTTGKTITVSAAPANTGNIYDTTQTGKPISVQQGSSIALTILFTYPGTVAPSGAVTISINGSSSGFSTPSCLYKTRHANCSSTYTANLAPGNYTVNFNVPADANYGAISGSAPLAVTGNGTSTIPVR